MAKPIHNIFQSGVDIAIWANDKGGANCTIQKSWKGKDNKYHHGNNFFQSDLAQLILACIKADAWIENYRAVERNDGVDANLPLPEETGNSSGEEKDDLPF